MKMNRSLTSALCRIQVALGNSSTAVSLIRAFSAQAAKGASQAAKPTPPPKQGGAPPQKGSGNQGGASAANKSVPLSVSDAPEGFVETAAEPNRPSTIVVQLKAKAHHPYYVNRFAVQLAKKFSELGLPRPSQVFLPKRIERWTVLKSPHVDKKAREQFERITHKRLFEFKLPDTQSNIEYAYRVLSQVTGLSPGVEVRAIYKVSAGDKVRA